jgi:hypothetical protein
MNFKKRVMGEPVFIESLKEIEPLKKLSISQRGDEDGPELVMPGNKIFQNRKSAQQFHIDVKCKQS